MGIAIAMIRMNRILKIMFSSKRSCSKLPGSEGKRERIVCLCNVREDLVVMLLNSKAYLRSVQAVSPRDKPSRLVKKTGRSALDPIRAEIRKALIVPKMAPTSSTM